MREGEPVHVGMDFNVGKMAAVIHVLRGGMRKRNLRVGGVLSPHNPADVRP